MRRATVLLALAGVCLTASACSQITNLAPVSGGPLATVRNGVYDVLVANDVKILVAPQCVQEATQFSCTGTTTDGAPILATATLTSPYSMTVTVAGAVLYDGDVQEALDQAAEEAP